MDDSSLPLIALTGNPNTGKTALFNALTGSRHKVANYAGVTVERKEGIAFTRSGRKLRILDLPGSYSLDAKTPDETITRDVILGHQNKEERPQVFIVVADATNLERSLSFVLELRALNQPVLLALNMIDLALKRGLDLDLTALEKELRLPIFPTVAVKKKGIEKLLSQVEKVLEAHPQEFKISSDKEIVWKESTHQEIKNRFHEVDRILKQAIRKTSKPALWTERIDRVVLHPFWGSLILILSLGLMFQAIFSWASLPMEGIELLMAALGNGISSLLPQGALQSLLVDGVIAGVGSVLVFLPQILLLFFFILLLEDSGYMARAAFLMDRLMGKVGLHGRAFIPLLSSYACAIPGILSTRTIENPKDRITTILIAPLTTCSARLPVYSLLIAAFIPNTSLWGFLKLQGIIMFILYFIGIGAALSIGFIFKKTLLKGPKPLLLLELPTYKIPSLRNILINLYERAKVFIKRAGTLILGISIMLWFLSSYPKAPPEATQPVIHYSFAGRIGHAIEPLVKPIGFDWRIGTGLIPGFAAREVMVSALATVYAVGKKDGEEVSQKLVHRLASEWSLATALSLLVWYIFAPQCLATLAVVRRETESWRWPLVMFTYMLTLAYMGSLLTYHIARYLGGA